MLQPFLYVLLGINWLQEDYWQFQHVMIIYLAIDVRCVRNKSANM